jgi:hypothetical protein
MKTLITLLLLTASASAQTINNNATVNVQGTNQSITVSQVGSNHTATVNVNGDNVSVIANQSGPNPQSLNFTVTCNNSCPTSPYVINQY